MPLEQLWLFTTITLVLSASPGPVMLACMIDAGRYGFAKSTFTMLGASTGNLVLMLLSALGLGLLVEQAEWIFHTIKWIGAAYLVYLGIQLVRAPALHVDLDARAIRRYPPLHAAAICAADGDFFSDGFCLDEHLCLGRTWHHALVKIAQTPALV
jgi:homoserine/homoserine lactone efflux protein